MTKNNSFFLFIIVSMLWGGFGEAQSLRDKIGQMIMVGFAGTTTIPDSLSYDLQKRNLGGVILYGNNVVSAAQVKKLTDTIRSRCMVTPFISIDQEGGKVARFNRSNGFDTSYTAYNLGVLIGREDSVRIQAARMSGWLVQTGINVNFAPVVDVNVNPLSPAIGKLERSFSKFPDTVAKYAGWFIDESMKKNVVTSLKHFPGHGSAATDSHLGFTDITNTWADSELVPYRKLIGAGYGGMVMVGHLFNAKIDSVYPASLSDKAVKGLLRNTLGYKGTVITDELFMQAIASNYTFEQAVVRAVLAGDDILLFGTNIKNKLSVAGSAIDIIAANVASGVIPSAVIDSAYNHIMNMKRRYNIVGVEEPLLAAKPERYELMQNFPNPFNPVTTIRYQLPERAFVTLAVYDITGRKIAELIRGEQGAGRHEVNWNASSMASGVYLYRLEAGTFSQTKKLILLK
ncbi:MAG: T9SS type A sorting domain-containing protein [Ignavibacteria bacterium]|nr:T9SS type A sorting domain-containing protein [Ignavibacteria bacterium]